jgi:hypothetical protein
LAAITLDSLTIKWCAKHPSLASEAVHEPMTRIRLFLTYAAISHGLRSILLTA